MAKIEFIGKSAVITENKERVMVVSDLHLGYGQSLRESGVFVFNRMFEEMIAEFENLFQKIGRVNEIIILGDVKHEIGKILRDERDEIAGLLRMMERYCDKIVVIKGNHDVLLNIILQKPIELVNYYLWKDCVFLHGDKDYEEIHQKNITTWFIGHVHPAITLAEGAKSEKYKCFLQGKYEGKKVVIIPSFFPGSEGSDPRSQNDMLPWDFKLGKFETFVVSEEEILNFGVLDKISQASTH